MDYLNQDLISEDIEGHQFDLITARLTHLQPAAPQFASVLIHQPARTTENAFQQRERRQSWSAHC